MKKKIVLDRYGNCPICHTLFRTPMCKHSYNYVQSVLDAANGDDQFTIDVNKVKENAA